MPVVLKYTLAERPCGCSDPAQRAGAAQGTSTEGVGETAGWRGVGVSAGKEGSGWKGDGGRSC